jgi:raffinose/stachyose/melibiose transport system substrate-binding protein
MEIVFRKIIGGREMIKKIVAVLASTFLLAGLLAGCASNANGSKKAATAKLVFLNGSVQLVDYYNTLFKTYNSTNKDNITIEQEYQTDATTNLQVRMAAGDVPDIINASLTQDMIDNHRLVDLTNMSLWKDLSPEMKTYSTDVKSGKVYQVPLLKSLVGVFYNKTIFNQLGLKPADTWADFVNNLKTIKEKMPNVVPFYMGAKDGWMLQQMSNFTMMSPAFQKLSYVDQQKAMQKGDLATLSWDTSSSGALVTFATDLLELQKDGLVNSNIVTATYDNQTTAFAAGQAAVTVFVKVVVVWD